MKKFIILAVIFYMVAQQIIIHRYSNLNTELLNTIDDLLEVCE